MRQRIEIKEGSPVGPRQALRIAREAGSGFARREGWQLTIPAADYNKVVLAITAAGAHWRLIQGG